MSEVALSSSGDALPINGLQLYAQSLVVPSDPDWWKTIFPEGTMDLEQLAKDVQTEGGLRALLVFHDMCNPLSTVRTFVKFFGEEAYLGHLPEIDLDVVDDADRCFVTSLAGYSLYVKKKKDGLLPKIYKMHTM